MHARGIACWFTFALRISCLVAQEPELARLLRLGPVPDGPTVVILPDGARGMQHLADSAPLVVLQIDAATPAHIVTSVLHTASAKGVRSAHFLATLPDGSVGAFALALPGELMSELTLSLRAHHQRQGVPPSSALPVLQSLRQGWERTAGRRFALDLEVPQDATWQQVLTLLGVAAEAGISSVVPRTVQTTPVAPPKELALDLVGAIRAQILATPAASPRPVLATNIHGCSLSPLPLYGPAPCFPGGSTPTGLPPWLEPEPREPRHWWVRQQRSDGAFVDDSGQVDVEAVSLVALMILGDGNTLDSGIYRRELQRCIGWMVANQRTDGNFEDFAAGSIQRHAQATWVLVEAAGRSASGDLLRLPASAALRWLLAARQADGVFGVSREGSSDPVATAWAVSAIAAAERFDFDVPHRPAMFIDWYDRHGSDGPLAAAAELHSRVVAGQDPEVVPRMGRLVDLLRAPADVDDPQALFWTSYALFRFGGSSWRDWRSQLENVSVKQQVMSGALRGSWEPRGGRSRITSTALHTLVIEAYYQYSHLVR